MAKNLEKFLYAKSPIKIFVSYHRKFMKFCSKVVIPMHVGRAVAKEPAYSGVIKDSEYEWLMNNTIGDDTGDNISAENRKYCELTAQYWVWKHLDEFKDTDYIGFMHYRRQFLFNDKISTKNRTLWGLSVQNVFCVNSFRRLITFFNLNQRDMLKKLSRYDCVVLKPFDVTHLHSTNLKDHFGFYIRPKESRLDVMEETIKELYPEYSDFAEEVLKGHMQILCNMYVMKKELFAEYAKFLFSILKKLDEKFDYTENEPPNALRAIAYIGEMLLTIFIFKNKDNLKINYLNGLFYGEGNNFRLLKLLKLYLVTTFN